jgi:hypothetical protein
MQQPKIPRIIANGSGLLSYILYTSILIYELVPAGELSNLAGVLTVGGLEW